MSECLFGTCPHIQNLEKEVRACNELVLDRTYKGYRLVSHGYYHPDRCRWWHAENIETGEADFHAHTMHDLKAQIDEAHSSIGK